MYTNPLLDIADRLEACIHGTCVAVQGRGLLLVGESGTGKSTLALQMLSLGAQLVADDRVDLKVEDDHLVADSPPQIVGLIEARGIGLLRAESVGPIRLAYVVDLDQTEPARLPEPAEIRMLRQTVPLLRAAGVANLAASLMQLARMGRVTPEWPNT